MHSPVTGRALLLESLRHHRGRLAAAAVLLCGHQAGEALVPVLVGVVIDEAVGTGSVSQLLVWLGVLGLDFLVLSLCYRFGARSSWVADVRADQRTRHRVADRVLHPGGGAESAHLPGELTTIAVSDAKRVGVLHFVLPLGVAGIAALVVAAVALLRISVPLGLLILLGTPPLLVIVQLLGRPLERRSAAEQERAAQASGVAADLVAGVRVLKGIAAEPAAVRRYTATSRDALAATLGATGAQARYQGSVLAVNGLFLALVAFVGGRLAADGAISIGELVSAVGLAQFLIGPLEIFGYVGMRYAQARASAERIAAVLSTAPAVTGEAAVPAGPGRLRIQGLRTAADDPPLDLDVAAGETVGLVAPPATASALLAVLGRERVPLAGTVELDGADLTTVAPEAARAEMIVAAHDARLFAGTLRENIGGTDGADAAIEAARVDQVAEVLPDGHETDVAAEGSSLSGGQRQRVALARALAAAHHARILVLHDPTTAVDAVTEADIAAGVRSLRAGRTTLVVTTSPALLATMDRVVVLHGAHRLDGTHADLLRADATYRELVLS